MLQRQLHRFCNHWIHFKSRTNNTFFALHGGRYLWNKRHAQFNFIVMYIVLFGKPPAYVSILNAFPTMPKCASIFFVSRRTLLFLSRSFVSRIFFKNMLNICF